MEKEDLIIEKMNLNHLDEVLKIEVESFPGPWTRGMFISEMNSENSFMYIFRSQQEIIAYGCLRLLLDEAHIMNLAVKKDFRKKGYGKKVLDFLIGKGLESGIDNYFLEVGVNNLPAVRLYKKNGFSVNRIRKKYYGPGEDAYEMSKKNGTPIRAAIGV